MLSEEYYEQRARESKRMERGVWALLATAALVLVLSVTYVCFFMPLPPRNPHVVCPKCGEHLTIGIIEHEAPEGKKAP